MSNENIEAAVREILTSVGEDPDRAGLRHTPQRVRKMYAELLSGYSADPDALLNGALFEVEYDEMVVVRDIEYYSLCLPSRQLVDAVGGQIRAADIQVGTPLYTLHEGRRKTTRVASIQSRKARELIELTPHRPDGTLATPIRVTPEHPVMTPQGWREAGDLRPGDCVEYVEPRRANQKHFPVHEGYDLGYALGAVAADGSIQDHRRISLCVREAPFAERFARALTTAFPGIHPCIEPVRVPSGYLKREVDMFRVRVVSSHIAGLMLKWLNCPGPQKETREFHFPKGVLRSQEMMQGFLDGYIEGDGNVAGSGFIITSANAQFLRELGEAIETRPARQANGMWRLYVSRRWAQAGWYGRHGFRPEVSPYDLRDSSFVEIAKVNRRTAIGKKPFTVYSFKCEPYPSFCVSGVLTHNCEHHLLPFIGHAHVAYIPRGKVLGLSKIPRIVDMFARRLQVQERLTTQIANFLVDRLQPQGVAVVMEGLHMCSMMRGVKKADARMVSSAMRGLFRKNAATRSEFMQHIQRPVGKGY